jgi:A/G-specific adenine glycosylase
MNNKYKEIAEKLINWYKKDGFNFPWRDKNVEPFVNLVTELMLQRTNTTAVKKFYPTIKKKYSNPDDIINAKFEEIIDDLRFLGFYNKRAKVLKEMARVIKKEFGGIVPESEEKLRKIKGIGSYIARAVLCFSFNKRVSIIDSNVTRIISRFFNIDKNSNKKTREKVELLLPEKSYKDFNYALLDLGALICKPNNPNCKNCPINKFCVYYKRNL